MSIGASNAVVSWERSGSGSIAGANAPDPAGAQRAVGAERKATFAEVAALLNSEDSRKPAAANAAKPSSFKFWQNEDFGFGDLVDIINPLQHIPIVSTIYRNLTGDQIGPAPRVIGGALWGRVSGLVAGVVNTVVEWFTGKDIGDHIYAALFGAPKAAAGATAVAQSKTPAALGENKAAPALSASGPSALGVFQPAVVPLSAITEGALGAATLHPAEPIRAPAADSPKATNLPGLDSIAWTAASALHIFQNHDRHLDRKDQSSVPLLRYIA
jgi:hypothetical protein